MSTKSKILAGLMPNQELVELNDSDILFVKRTTKGNLIPVDGYALTVEEAKKENVWDSCRGTMDFWVQMHPDYYEDALAVRNQNGFVFAIRNHAEDI